MSSWVDLALLLRCEACGAEPSYWCVTYRPTVREPGLLTTSLHSSRTTPAYDAWRAARSEGAGEALEQVAYSLTCRREGQWWAERDGIPLITGGQTVEAWLRERAESYRTRGY